MKKAHADEKAMIEKALADEQPIMNWPPSRGPKPDWMKGPELIFPEPSLIVTPEALADLGIQDDDRRDVEWLSVWTQVQDLVDAGPRLCDRLVSGARLKYDERRSMAYAELVTFLDAPRSPVADAPTEPQPGLGLAHGVVDGTPRSVRGEHITLYGALSYPLNCTVGVRIDPYLRRWPARETPAGHLDADEQKDMSLGYVLWSLARAYEMIYAEADRFGVWGHAMSDLGFERIAIHGGRVNVFVGS